MTIRAIVTDIEGTTSALSFVKDVLFPYARSRLPSFVRENPVLCAPILADVRALQNAPSLSDEQCIDVLLGWADADKKIAPLKTLQGLIWEYGYAEGAFQGHIYDDAAAALRRWHALGFKLYIYSSGSVAAQKLLFGHSEAGDLTPLFSGYFDTLTGGKLEADSYRKIAACIELPPSSVLFLSDNPDELKAAKAAGMHVIGLERDGPVSALRPYHPVSSFEQITPGELIHDSAA